jgi:RNA polymerase sigma factor (sigma-70 family)
VSTELARRTAGLDDLYEAHFADLMKVAFLMTGSAATAEDAVHEVFVRCIGRIDRIDHPRSYLRAAVINECRNQYRKRERADAYRRDAAVRFGSTGLDDLPHELMETRDALAALTPRQRAAIVLRYFVDLPDEQIAEMLGCRPATVRSLIHRAVAQLREVLS